MNYTYKGVEYTTQNKTFKPYRVKAIMFINEYNEFESKYTSTLQADINNFLITNKAIQGKIINAKNTSDTSKLNKVVSEALLLNPEYAMKVQELAGKKLMAKELFLTTNKAGEVSDENAKKLCQIMLEKTESIDHNPDSEDEYKEYMEFINKLFNDFFLKFKV